MNKVNKKDRVFLTVLLCIATSIVGGQQVSAKKIKHQKSKLSTQQKLKMTKSIAENVHDQVQKRNQEKLKEKELVKNGASN